MTLSDELKIYYNLGDDNIGKNINYEVYLNTNNTSTLIYTGQIYYMRPSFLYYKDLISPFVIDNKWFRYPADKSNTESFNTGIFDFTVTIKFNTGHILESEVITNITTIPTIENVTLNEVPSIYPKFKTDSEFFFGWKCKGTTDLKTSTEENTLTDATTLFTTNETGYKTVSTNINFELIKSLWVTNSIDGIEESNRIALIDQCDSRYFLIWVTRNNDYICRPFCKKYTLNETVNTEYITSLNDHRIPYIKSSDYMWELNSNWMTYNEQIVYESLLVSQYVYLYDNETGKKLLVNIINNEWQHKNTQNTKKPFNLTVTVQLDHKEIITY